MTEELKPCPFCGGTSCGVRAGTDQIWCVCGGHSPYGWSSRPIEDQLRSENERLKNELERVKQTFSEIAEEVDKLNFVGHRETKHLMRLLRWAIDKDTFTLYEKE